MAGLKCYANLSEIPADLDFVVVAVPAEKVPPVIQECVNCSVKAVVVISGGFRETGGHGKGLEERVARIIKGTDTRVLGPNCIGIYDAYSGVDTLFYPPYRLPRPAAGKISFISQSGAYGGALLGWAATREIGISKFISCGNMVDVNEIELLEYLGDDPTTQTILMYLEQTTNGRKLIETARTIAREKPIIALKAGRTTCSVQGSWDYTCKLVGRTFRFCFRSFVATSYTRQPDSNNNKWWWIWSNCNRLRGLSQTAACEAEVGHQDGAQEKATTKGKR